MELIEKSQKILVIAHFRPDPDAYASMLFTYGVLKENFPNKEIRIYNSGPISSDYSYLQYFEKIETGDCLEFISTYNPDLLIILDSPSFDRISDTKVQEIRDYIKSKEINSIWIDHHQPEVKDEQTLYINELRSSAVETAFLFFVKQNKLKLYENVANTVLLGISGDTARFLYKNKFHRDTFSIVSDMIDMGGSLEFIEEHSNKYSTIYVNIYEEFLKNLQSYEGYNYSYLSDSTISKYKSDLEKNDVRTAYHNAMNIFIRNFNDNNWGFIVLPDLDAGNGYYKTSFRASSTSGIDTTKFTVPFGGGGHIQASAAAKIPAKDINEAIQKIQQTIKNAL